MKNLKSGTVQNLVVLCVCLVYVLTAVNISFLNTLEVRILFTELLCILFQSVKTISLAKTKFYFAYIIQIVDKTALISAFLISFEVSFSGNIILVTGFSICKIYESIFCQLCRRELCVTKLDLTTATILVKTNNVKRFYVT